MTTQNHSKSDGSVGRTTDSFIQSPSVIDAESPKGELGITTTVTSVGCGGGTSLTLPKDTTKRIASTGMSSLRPIPTITEYFASAEHAVSGSSKLVVRRTANTTPERGWDYEAWYGDIDLGVTRGFGATPNLAIQDLEEQREEA